MRAGMRIRTSRASSILAVCSGDLRGVFGSSLSRKVAGVARVIRVA